MPRKPSPPQQHELPLTEDALDAARLRKQAEAALGRQRRRRRAKALALELALAEEERRTEDYLRRQAEARERAARDPRLDALLAFRRRGKPVAEALAEVDRRFSAAELSGPWRLRTG